MFKTGLLSLAVAGLFAAGNAYALNSFSSALTPGFNTVSDDNAEIIIKADATVVGGYRPFIPGVDRIQSGDLLIGMVGITSFPTSGASVAATNEVTAVYALQANSLVAPLPGAACGAASISTCELFDYAAPSIGLNTALGLANLFYGTGFGTGYVNVGASSFAVVLEDATPDFSRLGSLNAASASASDGTERLVFDLLAGDNFFTTGPSDVSELSEVAPGGGVGSISASATISYQNIPGWILDPRVNATGSLAQATGGSFPIWSNTDYTFTASVVSAPGSLALAGLALAGLGLGLRRRKAG